MTPGLAFRERMAGYISVVARTDTDFDAAASRGRSANRTIDTDLTIEFSDLDQLLDTPQTPGRISGSLFCPFLSDSPLTITWGEFVLLVPDPSQVDTENMRYRIHARAVDGSRYVFEGKKEIRNGPAHRAWKETTTLFTTISEFSAGNLECSTFRGILRISVADLRRMVTSIEVRRARSMSDELRLRSRFLLTFLGSLWPFFAGSLDEGERFAPSPSDTPSLPVVAGVHPEATRWCDPDGTWHDQPVPSACSRLIRYRGGDKGPVILAAGFAMSATSFALGTGGPSLVQFLLDRHFDVWLFDYRAGIELPSAWSQCTIDEIAQIDWPRAVAEVTRVTGSPDVQAIGHCVGSVSLLMTLLHGTTGIRSAICAQFTVLPVTSALNRSKASLRIGSLLADLGVVRMSPDTVRRPADVALDLALRPIPMPHGERCGSAACRWINAIFGLTHVHGQLDDAAHRKIAELFGVANVRALRHLVLMLQEGRVVDSNGLDRYLPNVGRLGLPIHFLSGTRNYIFHPEGTERTMNWLRDAFGPIESERFTVNYLEGYGHLDAIIGKNAAADVFPDIAAHLDSHPRTATELLAAPGA